MLLRSLLFLSLFTTISHAKNLGTHGTTFEIQERSLLTVIQDRLKQLESTGKIESLQTELQQQMAKRVNRPLPVSNIAKATRYQTRLYDPSFVVSEDIKDHQGKVIAKKGDSYNPLDKMSFGVPLTFIDGDDKEQVQWALSREAKIVLIKGAPLELRKDHKREFYFDQGGVLCDKFGITEIPARVSQHQKKLLVEMIPVAHPQP